MRNALGEAHRQAEGARRESSLQPTRSGRPTARIHPVSARVDAFRGPWEAPRGAADLRPHGPGATAVKDMQAQRAFYTGKLGFEQRGGSGPAAADGGQVRGRGG